MDGPDRPFIISADAAPQLHHNGHSFMVQHFFGESDGSADLPTFGAETHYFNCNCEIERRGYSLARHWFRFSPNPQTCH